jgi:hypothetical protein
MMAMGWVLVLLALVGCGPYHPTPLRGVSFVVPVSCETTYDPAFSWCAEWDADGCCTLLLGPQTAQAWWFPQELVPGVNNCWCAREVRTGLDSWTCVQNRCARPGDRLLQDLRVEAAHH